MSECDICQELAGIKATLADHGEKLSILLTGVGKLVAGPSPGFTVDAVSFDGTNDYLVRGAALTGVADSGTFIFSCWAKIDSTGPFLLQLIGNQSSTVQIVAGGEVAPTAYDSGVANGLENGGATNVIDDAWHHILVAGKASTSELSVYIDGALDSGAASVIGSPSAFNFADTDWAIAADNGGGSMNAVDMAEVYFAPGQYLDFSVSGNRLKFRSAGGKPVDLGSDGSTPTGVAPAVYLHIDDGEAAANFANNAGSGGNFTVIGSLTTAATSPSD